MLLLLQVVGWWHQHAAWRAFAAAAAAVVPFAFDLALSQQHLLLHCAAAHQVWPLLQAL